MGFVTTSKPLSILLLEPIPLTSHHIWAVKLIKELLRKGHHVHVVSIHKVKIEGKFTQNLIYAVTQIAQKYTMYIHYIYVHGY